MRFETVWSAVGAWGLAHHPFERLTEGRLRLITNTTSNLMNLGVCRAQKLNGLAESIAPKIVLGGSANARLEARGKAGA